MEKIKKEITVEKALSRLETSVEELENGNIGLDDAFEKFERAVKISKFISKKLKDYERRIQVLKEDPSAADGYKLENFNEEADSAGHNTIHKE